MFLIGGLKNHPLRNIKPLEKTVKGKKLLIAAEKNVSQKWVGLGFGYDYQIPFIVQKHLREIH